MTFPRAKRVAEAGLTLAGAFALAAPAHAQLAGSISLSSSEMFRGESISSADPALSASVSLDSGSGLFAGASATVALNIKEPRVSAAVQYLGFAQRHGSLSYEVGVIHRSYARIADRDYRRGFFEGFVGVGIGGARARVYVSPDYLVDGRTSFYAEINAPLLRHEKWQLDGHAGLSLIPHELGARSRALRHYQDWRLTVSRPVGPLFLSLGINATNYPVYSDTGRGRVFASAAYAF